MAEVKIPNPPAHLPKSVAANWTKTYRDTLKQATADLPENPSGQHTTALRAANALVKVQEPENHEQAAKLVEAFKNGSEDGWKIIAHGTRNIAGKEHLAIVTANGRKHLYPVPAGKPAASATT
jgi:hypothetical protein